MPSTKLKNVFWRFCSYKVFQNTGQVYWELGKQNTFWGSHSSFGECNSPREAIRRGGSGRSGNESSGNASLPAGYIKIFIDILTLLPLPCCFDLKAALLAGMLQPHRMPDFPKHIHRFINFDLLQDFLVCFSILMKMHDYTPGKCIFVMHTGSK